MTFYAHLFGWTPLDVIDLGGMGKYQVFGVNGVPKGGIMNRPEGMSKSGWLLYFNVGDIHAAAKQATGANGRLLMEPHRTPQGDLIFQAVDPQGAVLGLLAPR